jgi:hypothetical protein
MTRQMLVKIEEVLLESKFEASVFAIEQSSTRSMMIPRLGIERHSFALCTLHHTENTDDRMRLVPLLIS